MIRAALSDVRAAANSEVVRTIRRVLGTCLALAAVLIVYLVVLTRGAIL